MQVLYFLVGKLLTVTGNKLNDVISFQMQKTGSTLMKVTCQLVRICRVRTMDRVSHMMTMCMITLVWIVVLGLREGIAKFILVVNQRIVTEGNAYRKIPILRTLFVFVHLEEWEYSVRQVGTILWTAGAWSSLIQLPWIIDGICHQKTN